MPTTDRPNILLIMTDQQRGDCLGAAGHPVVQTPQLDELAGAGTRFNRAYSTCPSCIAARRSLLSGQFPTSHGMVGYAAHQQWEPAATLPDELRKAGYHTGIVGRNMHQHPFRKRYGYEQMSLAGGVNQSDDYSQWLKERVTSGGNYYGAGPGHNDWVARPWHQDENLHQTNWTVDRALEFLEKRDPTVPYFLTVSFLAPHPPLTPPAFYYDRYRNMDLSKPAIGDWCAKPDAALTGSRMNASRIDLKAEALASMQAGYFGLINHVDDQLRRIFNQPTSMVDANTVVIFTSDHGEMLGDHYMFRKSEPYQSSACVPMIFSAPKLGINQCNVRDEAVCLEDIMPTCLELAGVPIPPSVDGRSLVPLLTQGKSKAASKTAGKTAGKSAGKTASKAIAASDWREWLFGEHAPNAHYVTDGRYKFVWRPADGSEQFFDLDKDPKELHNLVSLTKHKRLAVKWRKRLVDHLTDRPEGFVKNGKLIAGQPYGALIPR